MFENPIYYFAKRKQNINQGLVYQTKCLSDTHLISHGNMYNCTIYFIYHFFRHVIEWFFMSSLTLILVAFCFFNESVVSTTLDCWQTAFSLRATLSSVSSCDQGRYSGRVGKRARRMPHLCLIPFPFRFRVSPHNPCWISREKQTASSLVQCRYEVTFYSWNKLFG